MINQFKVIVSAVIMDNNTVLLAKRSESEDAFPGHWGIPGGTVEIDNAQPDVLKQTLLREVTEEVGNISIELGEIIESTAVVRENDAKLYIIFKAKFVSGQPRPLDGTNEITWASYEQAKKPKLTPGTLENIKHVIN